MSGLPENSEKSVHTLRARIRFDYKGERSGRLFGGKSSEKVAEEVRENKAALLRNVPLRGLKIEEIDTGAEIYTVYDEDAGKETAFAPLEVVLSADTIEDVLSFIMRPEFRKIEIIQPEKIVLSFRDIERLCYRVAGDLNVFAEALIKKLSSR